MTITIAKLNTITGASAAPDHNLAPGMKVVAVKITMDGSFLGTGEACDMSSIFPTKCFGMCRIGDSDGWYLAYEPAAASYGTASGKIIARWTTTAGHTADAIATSANLTGVVCHFLAFGC